MGGSVVACLLIDLNGNKSLKYMLICIFFHFVIGISMLTEHAWKAVELIGKLITQACIHF